MIAALTAYPQSAVTSSGRRGNRAVRAPSGAARRATISAYAVTSNPARETGTWKLSLISGSSPVGSISTVTDRNAAPVSVRSPTSGRLRVGAVDRVMHASRGQEAPFDRRDRMSVADRGPSQRLSTGRPDRKPRLSRCATR